LAEEIVILPQSAISTFLFPVFLNHFVPKITCLATHKHWDVWPSIFSVHRWLWIINRRWIPNT